MATDMTEDGETGLGRRTFELVDSVISSTYSSRYFPLKWQLIRDKLEQLSSALAAAAAGGAGNCPKDNLLLPELLHEITSTAGNIQLLSRQCSGESYSGGKLQLRSDLDVVAAKLELHIKRMPEIYASGMVIHSRAIILSKPGAGATREEMRFYVKDIITRLRIGDSEVRARALAALNDVLRDDDKYARILVAETDGGLSLLVSLLEFGEMGIQDEASEAVSVIARFSCRRGALVSAGAVAPLIRVLETGSLIGKERAAQALKRLTENSDNAWSVSSHGGVPVLLRICGDDGSRGELIGTACCILRNLSGVGEISGFMVEEGIASVLVKLSKSKDELIRIQSIEFLNSLLSKDDSIKQKVIREGMIESLVHVLDPIAPSSSKVREAALKAIDGLCFSSPNSMNILLNSGFLNRLLFLVRNGETSTQESALKAACRFCGSSEEARKAMGDAGFMPELMKLLDAKSFDVRETAAEVLCRMVSVQRNRRRFIQEDLNVNRILQLLDPEEEKSVTKKSLLSVLMYLTDSNSGRRKLAASGYVKNLEKLAETDAMDAKKIIKKLSSNRFRSILSRIWGS